MPTFETQGGTNPGVTVLNADGTVHTAHTTAGFTEAVTGSGVYNYPHPSPGTLLEFVFDAAVGGTAYYASVWDDGLSPQGAAEAALVAQPAILTAEYDHAKDDLLTPLGEANAKLDVIGAATAIVDDVLITPATLDTDDVALGITTAGASITAYVSTDTTRAAPKRKATAESDGGYSFGVRPGATYTLYFELDGFTARTRTVTV